MNPQNHNRQAAWLGRGWSDPATSTKARHRKVHFLDIDDVIKISEQNGDFNWPTEDQLSSQGKFTNLISAEDAGKDFPNPDEANPLFVHTIEQNLDRF